MGITRRRIQRRHRKTYRKKAPKSRTKNTKKKYIRKMERSGIRSYFLETKSKENRMTRKRGGVKPYLDHDEEMNPSVTPILPEKMGYNQPQGGKEDELPQINYNRSDLIRGQNDGNVDAIEEEIPQTLSREDLIRGQNNDYVDEIINKHIKSWHNSIGYNDKTETHYKYETSNNNCIIYLNMDFNTVLRVKPYKVAFNCDHSVYDIYDFAIGLKEYHDQYIQNYKK